MEIDKKQLLDLLLWFWEKTEKAQADLNAHQVAITVLKLAGNAQEFDQVLEQARQHPSPRLLAIHQEVRDTIEALLHEEKTDELLNFLRKWKPSGPIQ